jgi:hypothetical protein
MISFKACLRSWHFPGENEETHEEPQGNLIFEHPVAFIYTLLRSILQSLMQL